MNLIIHIPKGRRNRQQAEQIMFAADIYNKDDFKKELREVKKTHIVIFDDGYYIPVGNELQGFIDKCDAKIAELTTLRDLAKKLMI